ncbi:MAG: chemotaxis protein CheD [Acidobacteria bacterium]|nr:MAG: chemotaxis protein CheD [Acidobacteriota bacterium]
MITGPEPVVEYVGVKHIVGIADMQISRDPDDLLVTYALGSCLGIAIYDPTSHVGGLLHVMLPLSTIDPVKAKENPCMFVDTGVPILFHKCYEAGANRDKLLIKVAGGANVSGSVEDRFEIGKRNFLVLRKLLWRNGLLLQGHDVGGHHSRTLALEISTGQVRVKANGIESVL